MKNRILILAFLYSGITQFLFGQSLANYKAPNGSLVRTTGITYNSIEFTGNAVPSWRFTGAGAEDDDRSFPVNIGFDFWYLGTRYTTFSVSTNGFIDFSTSTRDGGPATNQYGSTDNDLSQPATATTRTMPLTIAPFYYDQTTDTSSGGLDALGNGIRYLTSGTTGSRVLTVEWIRLQPWYSGSGGSPQFNYQVKLYEGTGVIEFVYGFMDISTFSFAAQSVDIVRGYTSGMNGPTISAPPTSAQMLVQQTQNSATFSETGVNGAATNTPHTLQTIPVSYSKISFTPPVPSPATTISFTGITQTSMQVNWSDSPNDIGYVVYRSDDGGASYNFVTQLAPNTINYNQIGLLSGTTYYWKIYAISEGALSSVLTGNQATLPPGNDTSATSGLWSSPSTWKSGSVPGSAANVVIDDGHTVTIDQNVTANSLSIGKGTNGILQIGNDANARTVSIVGTIDVRTGGIFRVNTASNTSSHVLNASGNIQNSGTFDMSSDADSRATVNFIKSGTQSISGSGITTRFYLITMNLGGSALNVLDVFASNFSSTVTNYLTLTSGTFNLASGVTTTPFTGNITIPLVGGLRVNHSSAIVNTTGGSLTIVGELRVNDGTLNVGNASDNNLISNGGVFVFSGGSTNIAGRFDQTNSYALTNLTISGGTLTVNTTGSTSTTNAPFNMSVPGSIFAMSGGSIVVQRPGNPGGQNLGFVNTSYTNYGVTGGTVQIGNSSTPAASTIKINSSIPIHKLVVNSANVTAQLITNSITVLDSVKITAGTLNANGQNITVAGNWYNNGTFTPSTGKVTFNGTGIQTIADPTNETFYKLEIAKSSGTLTLSNNVTVTDSFAITSGILDLSTLTLTLNGIVVGGGTLNSSTSGTVIYNKSSAVQNILVANYGNLTFSNFTKTLPSSGTIGISGVFTPGTATGHTIIGSTIDYNSSLDQSISSFQYNNLILSNAGTKTIQSGADSVLGNLIIGANNTLADNGVALNTFGSIVNNGIHLGTGSIIFRGSTSQLLSGGGIFQNITVNNAGGVSMTGNTTINGTLIFTNGVFATGTDTITIGTSGSVSRTSGHVFGWLKKNVAVGSNISKTFEIGDATVGVYTPVTYLFATVTSSGNLSSTTVNTEHPEIISSYLDPTNNVNRYWQLVNSGGFAFNEADSFKATFTYINPTDLDETGSELNYRVNVFNGITWDSTAYEARTTTTNQARGLTALGVYGIGLQVTSGAYRSNIAIGNWNVAANWEIFNGITWSTAGVAPSSTSGLITIQSGHTITVTANVTIDQTIIEQGGSLVINGGTLTLNAGSTNCLIVNGTLKILSNNAIGNSSATRLKFNAGGTYEHAYTTTAARRVIPTATWASTSTVLFNGNVSNTSTTTFTNTLAQSFGNFIWNPSAQGSAVDFAGSLTTVNGNFQIVQTGTSTLNLFTNQTTTFIVGQSFIVNNGTITGKNNTGTVTVLVGGNDSITGGTFTLTSSGAFNKRVTGGLYVRGGTLNLSSAATIDSITLGGDLVLSGGTITESGAGSGIIALQGTTDQTFTSGATISNTINFVVLSGAIFKPGANVLTGNSFVLSSGANLKIGSAGGITSAGATGNIQTTIRSFSSLANYFYEGSIAQVTGVFTTTPTANTVFDLVINNSNGVTLSGNIVINDSLKLVNGNMGVSTFTLTINNVAILISGTLSSSATGTVNYNKNSAGQNILAMNYGNLTFSNFSKTFPSSGTVGIAGTFLKGLENPILHSITGSTVDFNGASQSIPKFTFNNLIISGSGTKTADSSIVVNGTFTLSAGTLALTTSSVIVTTKGNIVNNAATSGSGKITLSGGSTVHSVSGSGTYNNLEINDPFGAIASSDMTVNGTLTLTNGAFGMGVNTFVIASSGTTVQTSGYVNGKMTKTIPVNALPQTIEFEVGDATVYAPVSITMNAVSIAGTLTVSTTGVDHPVIKYSGLDQYKNVNRYWTLTNSGIIFTSYDITLNFVTGDLDAGANTNAFFAKRYNSTWYAATTVLRNSTWIKNLNNLVFGEFAVGEVAIDIYWTKGAGTVNWGDDNNWSTNSKPTTFNNVIFDGDDTIEVNVNGTTKNLIVQNDTLQLTILAGKSLTISGNLTQYSGIFSTRNGFPTVSGTTTLSGGTFGYDSSGGTQTVAIQSYNNLRISGGGTKTAAGVFTVNKNLTVGSGSIFADSGYVITVKENLTVDGLHTGSGKLLLDGIIEHQLTGAGIMTNLELNNSSNGVTLGSNIRIVNLTMTAGTMVTGPHTITITNNRIGNGIILGSIKRARTFIAGTAYAFEGPNNTITFNSGGTLPDSITVLVNAVSPGVNTYMDPIDRYYSISQNGGSGFMYTLKLHYETSEVVSPNIKATLKMWERTATGPDVWVRYDTTTIDTVANWVEVSGISSMGTWSLSSRKIPKIAITLSANNSNPTPGDTVTYTIAFNNTGDGPATNTIISASTPYNTMYAINSVEVMGNIKTDISDSDGVVVNSGNISVNLGTIIGTISPGVNGTIKYKVVIN